MKLCAPQCGIQRNEHRKECVRNYTSFPARSPKQVVQNQVSLRSLIYVSMCCALGKRWAADPGNSYRNALRFLRFPISVMLYAPHCGRMTTIPNPLGDFIPKPHLRFAAV